MDIGLEIKILRERKRMSAKELAERIGLSQSQMSRLEKGQRRIDTQVLHRIAKALDVTPAFFFEEAPSRRREIDPYLPGRELGKLVRSERRKRHLSAEELAKKIGRTKAFVQALEEGRHELDAGLATKITRALKLDGNFFLSAQAETIRGLDERIHRLESELSERSRGVLETASGPLEAIPILGQPGAGYPSVFDADGWPLAEVDDYVRIPDIDPEQSFALCAHGDSMARAGAPSFEEGDLLVFTALGAIRNRDLAYARLHGADATFRQVFFDPNGTVRLQPLNHAYPPAVFSREEVIRMWRLAAHVARG